MPEKKSRLAKGTRRDSYHHGDLKRALTDAALLLVAERGPKGFTLTEAARRAGVSVAAPYRHFADKAHLLASVAEQGFVDLHSALTAAASDPVAASDPDAELQALGRAYVRWAVTHPDHYRIMFGAQTRKADHPGLAFAAGQAFGDLLAAIARAQEAGMVGGKEPREVAGPLWSVVHGIASLAIDAEFANVGIDQEPEDMVASAVSEFVHHP
jgi:AcrR family transcriptional regulator